MPIGLIYCWKVLAGNSFKESNFGLFYHIGFRFDIFLYFTKATHCTGNRCMGSLMQPYGGGDDDRPYGVPRRGEEVKAQAIDFLKEFYASIKQ